MSARPSARGRLVAPLLAALVLAGTARTVRAAGDEIQVYLDDLAGPGEVGRVARRVSEEAWTVELRPILGSRSAHWLAAFNPILGFPVRSDTLARGEIEPAVKVGREVRRGLMLGLEYYAALGALDGLLPRARQEHVPFAVLDYEGHGLALNVGIGRGLTAASDQRVAKAIVSFRLRS